MSSFKDKAARAEKQKIGREPKKGAQTDASTLEQTEGTTEQDQELATDTTIEREEASLNTAGEFYGEDQQEDDQEKPKWERTIPLDRIRPNPYQPRKTFDPDKLNELASGMKEHGWVGGGLPVRPHASEQNIYELVWGERRWRAAGLAGLKAIPCVVSTHTNDDMIEKGLLENVQREDLTNLEEGQAYIHLLALKEEGKPRYSIRRLAARIGKDKSYIEDRLQYARVPLDVQQLAEDQPDISPRIIRELGELSKILQPEEREPVIEGVREGRLRIEDVRDIRKDVAQHTRHELPIVVTPEQSLPTELPSDYQSASTPPLASTMSVATDTPTLTGGPEEQPEVVNQEPEYTTPTPATSLASTVIVSVFEKTFKRDNEVLERIFQRLTTTLESLTESEQTVVLHYLKRWDTTIQDFIQRLELTKEQ